jgi:hypothetical protein
MEVVLPKSFDTFGKLIIGLSVAFVTYSVNEIRTDIKDLMASSNVSVTKIEALEARVNNLEGVMIFDRLPKSSSTKKEMTTIPQKVLYIKEEEEEYNKTL